VVVKSQKQLSRMRGNMVQNTIYPVQAAFRVVIEVEAE
jgi:hypothetical protein